MTGTDHTAQARKGTKGGLRRFSLLAVVSLGYGLFTAFCLVGNLLYWGLPMDGQSLWLGAVIGAGAAFAVPVLYLLHRQFLPSGGGFKWFLIILFLLGTLSLGFGNASFLVAHFLTLPHEHAPLWSILGLYQLFFTSLSAEYVFLTMLKALTLPFSPVALMIAAALFNRHFLMLHGPR